MLLERAADFFMVFYVWKCLNCGAMIDRTISSNRRKSLAAIKPQNMIAASNNLFYRGLGLRACKGHDSKTLHLGDAQPS